MQEEFNESNNTVDETTDQSARIGETNEESTLEADESKNTDSENEYRVALEQEKKRRERAEEKIVQLKREQKTSSETSIDDEDDVVEKLWKRLDSRLQERELQSKEREVDELVKEYSSNNDEAELIKYHLKHSIRTTGDLNSDITRAKLLANENRILNEKEELRAALKARNTSSTGRMHAGLKQKTTDVKLNEREKNLLQRFGALDDYKKKY